MSKLVENSMCIHACEHRIGEKESVDVYFYKSSEDLFRVHYLSLINTYNTERLSIRDCIENNKLFCYLSEQFKLSLLSMISKLYGSFMYEDLIGANIYLSDIIASGDYEINNMLTELDDKFALYLGDTKKKASTIYLNKLLKTDGRLCIARLVYNGSRLGDIVYCSPNTVVDYLFVRKDLQLYRDNGNEILPSTISYSIADRATSYIAASEIASYSDYVSVVKLFARHTKLDFASLKSAVDALFIRYSLSTKCKMKDSFGNYYREVIQKGDNTYDI